MPVLAAVCVAAVCVAACDKTPKPGAPRTPSMTTTAPTNHALSANDASTIEEPMATPKIPSSEETRPLANGSNAFAFDLWRRLPAKGNFTFSPASISMALAMTYGGANGETAEQMKRVMHFEAEPDSVMASWGALTKALTDPSRPMKLRIANRLFGEKTYAFEQAYLDRTRAAFGAPLEALDFKTESESARLTINGWVEKQTNDRIRDLVPPKAIDDLTRLVLVNAIYFLADWESPFPNDATRNEVFHVTQSNTKRVPTMHATDSHRLAHVDGTKVLELRYRGTSTAMLIALPDRPDGLKDLEASLSPAVLRSWIDRLDDERVLVALPRFEVTPAAALALADELKALGMPLAFDPLKADFTRMARPSDPREALSIGHVFHKAFVKVDEKGTEAAAATAVLMQARGAAPARPVEFRADHPFLFFIVDRNSGLVLFMGRVTDP